MALPYYAKKRLTDIGISIIMLMFLALTLLPVGWMVFSSLKSSSDIAIGRVGLSRNVQGQVEVHWDNYVDMWKNVNFGLYLKNSLIICGSTMVLAMIFSTLAAYALSRFKFPGADFFSNTILATQMIPAIMYLIPLYIMFVKLTVMTGIPIKGTYWGLILIYSAFFVPFSIWILRGFFASIPKELEEAARIDGCSPLQVFRHVALPLAMPGIIATGIYIFLQAWDELMFAWVLTNGDTMTIPVGIRLFVGNYQNRFDLMMAAATVATIPVVVLFFMLQKHIVRGLTAGAVKG
ncbi:MAG: carbohydrate ABC transporter permease [Candidatus Margulisiibacteriota bacterium]